MDSDRDVLPVLSPALKWYGAKNRAADVISAVILRAAREKWQPRGGEGLPFDLWAEVGAGTASVTCAAWNRLGSEAAQASWLLTDPAPGWANFMQMAIATPGFRATVASRLEEFDRLFEPNIKGEFSVAQCERFRGWRSELSERLSLPGPHDPLATAQLYWLVNRRGFNGMMRIGSGRKRASWDELGRQTTAVRFTQPVGGYGSQGPPRGGSAAEPLEGWSRLPAGVFTVTAETYAQALPRLTQIAASGKRVVVYIDSPYYKWSDDIESEYVKSAAELQAEAEAARARKRRGKKQKPEPEVRSGWTCTYAEYTPEGFPPSMWTELRELVVALVAAGGLVAVSGHYTTASWWTDTGVFWGARGEDEAAEAGLVLRPGEHHPLVAQPRELATGHIEMPSRGGGHVERRFIRADFFGIAGLGGRGLTLPVRQWVLGSKARGAVSAHPWLEDRR